MQMRFQLLKVREMSDGAGCQRSSRRTVERGGGIDHDIISVPYFALTPVNEHSPPSKDVWSHLGLGGHFPLKIAQL